MGALFGDLRYSVRSLAKDRAFTLVAVLTLTVCLGANVALFVDNMGHGSQMPLMEPMKPTRQEVEEAFHRFLESAFRRAPPVLR